MLCSGTAGGGNGSCLLLGSWPFSSRPQQVFHGLLLVAVCASQRLQCLLSPKAHLRYRLHLGLQAHHLLLRQRKRLGGAGRLASQ